MRRYQALARDSRIWLSLGGFQEISPNSTSHIFNSHVVLDESGAIAAVYRKIHLFDVDVPGGPVLKESSSTSPGREIVSLDGPSAAYKIGLSVCYDLRFPELYQRLRFDHGAQLLLVPAAFTVKTGQAHWEVLLRARAIECQCYIVAAAQAGVHNSRRESFGHSLIIDPWGTVIARCSEPGATDVVAADIDLQLLASIRQRMPIEQHRRLDIYGTSKGDNDRNGQTSQGNFQSGSSSGERQSSL